jgi:hypothetical protein
MSDDDLLVSSYRSRCYTKANMSSAQFMDTLLDGRGEHAQSYATGLDVLSDQLVFEAMPLTPFMVLPPEFNPAAEYMHRRTLLWMSQPNTTTPGNNTVGHDS